MDEKGTTGKSPEGDHFEDLVQRISAGDSAAEQELADTFRRGLSYMLRRLVKAPETSEDLLQDTLRIGLEKIRQGELRDPRRLPGFLRGIARNLVIAANRKQARRPRHEELDEVPEPVDSAPDPLQLALREEDRQRVRQLLGELASSRDRELLVRFHLGEEPKEEICSSMGLTVKQFNVAIFRARKRFRQLVEAAAERKR